MVIQYIWLAIAFPLAGVLLNGLLGRRLGRRFVSVVGPGVVALAFLVGLFSTLDLLAFPSHDRAVVVTLWDWIWIGTFRVEVSLLADPLSVLMVLVVTGVGLLIHVYSVGYMEHEDNRLYARFFTFMNLFIVSMLILVLAANYLLLYVGWELVGLCSYLLIGFWFRKRDEPQAPIRLKNGEEVTIPPNLNPADSGKKAFIVNRVGDFGFALGVFLIWTTFGTLNYRGVQCGTGSRHCNDDHHHVAAFCRCSGQECAVAALRVVAGRYGRPYAGVGSHSRGHYGHGRCLYDRP